jgi:hypothetical protein
MKYPVTLNQESLLLLEESMWNLGHLIEPISLPSAFILEGPLNVVALEEALNSVIERHASLRSAFMNAGVLNPSEREIEISALHSSHAFATGMYAQYYFNQAPIQLQMNLLQFMELEDQDIEIENVLRRSYKAPFHYSKPPLLKAHLFQLSFNRYLLVIMVHHLICDMYSLLILNRDLIALYHSKASQTTPSLPVLKRHFLDFAAEQYERIINDGYHKMIDYWGGQLLRYGSARLNWDILPSAFRGTADRTSIKIGNEEWALDHDLMKSLEGFAKKKGVTLYMLYVSACAIFFQKLLPNNVFTIAANLANKTSLDYMNAIGFFANIHIIGIELCNRSTVKDILTKVRTSVLNAIVNQSVPLQPVMKNVGPRTPEPGIRMVCDMIHIGNMKTSLSKRIPLKMIPVPAPGYLLSSVGGIILRFIHYGTIGRLSATFSEFILGNDGARSMLKEITNVMRWCVDHENESIANYKLLGSKDN